MKFITRPRRYVNHVMSTKATMLCQLKLLSYVNRQVYITPCYVNFIMSTELCKLYYVNLFMQLRLVKFWQLQLRTYKLQRQLQNSWKILEMAATKKELAITASSYQL